MSVTEEPVKYTGKMKVKRRSPHETWFGKPKRAYQTEFDAEQAAAIMQRATGHCFEVYVCRVFDDYVRKDHHHIGHAVQRWRDLSVSRQDDLMIEVGERVLSHMKAENRPNRTEAFKFLRRRMRSVYRLAMDRWVPPPRKLP